MLKTLMQLKNKTANYKHIPKTFKLQNNKRVIKNHKRSNSYNTSFGMVFITEDDAMTTEFTSCRDYLHDIIRTALNNNTRLDTDGHPFYPELKDPNIYLNYLKLVIQIDVDSLPGFENGISILNDLENFAGIRKTTAEKVSINNNTETIHILIEGDKCYMDNPHLLSLLTLVLRFCTLNEQYKCNSFKDFIEWDKHKNKSGNRRDSYKIHNCGKYLHIILAAHKKIFKDYSKKQLFPINIAHDFHNKGGIQSLCIGSVSDTHHYVKNNLDLIKEVIS